MDDFIKNSCLSEKGQASAYAFLAAAIRSDADTEDPEDPSHDWVPCCFKLPKNRGDLLEDPKFQERGMRALFCGFSKSANIITDKIDRNMIDKPCAILDNCRYLSSIGESGLFPLRNYRMKTLTEMAARMNGLCNRLKVSPVYEWEPIPAIFDGDLLDQLAKNPGSVVDMFVTKHTNPIMVFMVYTEDGLVLFSTNATGMRLSRFQLYKNGWWWMDWSYFEDGKRAPNAAKEVQFTVKCSTLTTQSIKVGENGAFTAI